MASHKAVVNKLVKKYNGIFIRKTKHGMLYNFNGIRFLISHTPKSNGWIKDFEKHLNSKTRIDSFKHKKRRN